MKYIIFEIDTDDHATPDDFMAQVEASKACGLIQNNVVKAVGGWAGNEAPAYIMRLDDFDRAIRYSGWVSWQDAFLLFTECNKKYAELEWRDGYREPMGSLMQVPRDVAMQAPGYTYRPDQDAYFVCVDGNNDHIPGKPIPPFAVSCHQLGGVA